MLDRTVDFDNKNSWIDYGVIFKDLTLSPPEPNLYMIEVPFRDGVLDETDYYGNVTYKTRQLTMTFLVPYFTKDHMALYSYLLNDLHGKRKKIKLSSDQSWYYEGRLVVGDYKVDGNFWGFTVTATVDPYKYRDTVVYYDLIRDGERFTIYNDLMPTIPTISTTNQLDLRYRGTTYKFSQGSFIKPEMLLKAGGNTFEVIRLYDGHTHLRIDFKEGRL